MNITQNKTLAHGARSEDRLLIQCRVQIGYVSAYIKASDIISCTTKWMACVDSNRRLVYLHAFHVSESAFLSPGLLRGPGSKPNNYPKITATELGKSWLRQHRPE